MKSVVQDLFANNAKTIAETISEKIGEMMSEKIIMESSKVISEMKDECMRELIEVRQESLPSSSSVSTDNEMLLTTNDEKHSIGGYPCTICHKSYATPYSLTRHVDSIHADDTSVLEPDAEATNNKRGRKRNPKI